jgi:hypothetical protein
MGAAVIFEGGSVARAKSTDRAEARRRYRQTATEPAIDAGELDYGERKPSIGASATKPKSGTSASPTGRQGFGAAFRQAYHPVHLREDLRAWREVFFSRGFLAAVGLVAVGAVVVFLFPGYTGSQLAWELLILPGSALAPQLVAGFFAPRASYLLGLVIGLLQCVIFAVFVARIAGQQATPIAPEEINGIIIQSFVSGPISGMLFASGAAWYRRFLAASSPKRAAAGKAQPKRR